MKQRTLGEGGPRVSAIGFGAMVLSPGVYGEVDDQVSIATLQRGIDLGLTLIDTAFAYGGGHSEELVGRAVRGRRDQVALATKGGLAFGASGPGTTAGRSRCARTWRPACGGSAPPTSTSTTCTPPIRKCRSRRASARWRGSSRKARSASWASRTCRSSRCGGRTRPTACTRRRTSTRSSTAGRTRKAASRRCARSASASSPTARSARVSSAARSRIASPRATSAPTPRAFKASRWARCRHSANGSAPSLTRRGSRPRRWRSPGCCIALPSSCRNPDPQSQEPGGEPRGGGGRVEPALLERLDKAFPPDASMGARRGNRALANH